MELDRLKAVLPTISDMDLLQALLSEGKELIFEAGEAIIEPGQYIKMVPVVIEGSIKIMRTDEEGHELFLYYIEPGQTCAVSLTCCSTQKPSEIKAVAEERTVVLGLPLQLHEQWTNQYRQWKEYVAETYQFRLHSMLRALDEIAFKKMDERLLKYLLVKAKQLKTNELSTTHQEIATELGTSREVVSRLLKELERRRIVELGRNKIYLRDDFDGIM